MPHPAVQDLVAALTQAYALIDAAGLAQPQNSYTPKNSGLLTLATTAHKTRNYPFWTNPAPLSAHATLAFNACHQQAQSAIDAVESAFLATQGGRLNPDISFKAQVWRDGRFSLIPTHHGGNHLDHCGHSPEGFGLMLTNLLDAFGLARPTTTPRTFLHNNPQASFILKASCLEDALLMHAALSKPELYAELVAGTCAEDGLFVLETFPHMGQILAAMPAHIAARQPAPTGA